MPPTSFFLFFCSFFSFLKRLASTPGTSDTGRACVNAQNPRGAKYVSLLGGLRSLVIDFLFFLL